MSEILRAIQEHPQLLTVPIGGGAGFGSLVFSTRAYQDKNPQKGSALLLAASTILMGTAAVNESLQLGHPGAYTASVTPFMLGSGAEYLKHHPKDTEEGSWYEKLREAAKKYTPEDAVDVNLAVRFLLWSAGYLQIHFGPDLPRHLAFALMSAGYVMPVEGPGKFTEKTAREERFKVIFWSRLALVGTLTFEFFNSLAEAYSQQDTGQINPYAGVWMLLNGINSVQDLKSMIAVMKTTKASKKP